MSKTATDGMTKKLEALLKRYSVALREGNQHVIHATKGWDTLLTPQQFAVFQAALSAVYLSGVASCRLTGNVDMLTWHCGCNYGLFQANGITLLNVRERRCSCGSSPGVRHRTITTWLACSGAWTAPTPGADAPATSTWQSWIDCVVPR